MTAVNWEAVIWDIRRRGFSPSAIAAEVGIDKAMLYRYCEGSVPAHDTGERMIVFWMRVTSSAREQVPICQPTLSAASARRW